jgi:hypothetical protein
MRYVSMTMRPRPYPSQLMCVEKDVLLRVRHISIARGYR